MQFRFGDYRLDLQRQELWQSDTLIPLRRKAFELLAYLLEHADRLITRDELVSQVWSRRFIDAATLNSCLREVRQAVGDNGRDQQVIVTLRGRGYRVVVPVVATDGVAGLRSEVEPAIVGNTSVSLALGMIGRDWELHQMQGYFADACRGDRQMVFVTGEPGIGKTTLVQAFIAQASEIHDFWLVSGQSIESYGAGEPFMPILDALGRLCRGVERTRIMAALHQQAPTWLSHLPWLLQPAERAVLPPEGGGSSRAHMLRELTELLETLARERPLVMVVEDLHWSDPSTLEWLLFAAKRSDRVRLLIIGTYRSVDALAVPHPLRGVTQELRLHRQSVELPLNYLPPGDVTTYLTQRFGRLPTMPELGAALHDRTGGNPLFLMEMVEELIRQGVVVNTDAGWQVSDDLATVSTAVPVSLRQLVEYHLIGLEPFERSLLETASVAGVEFSAAVVAAGLEVDDETVETQCEGLVLRGQFLREAGVETWPDGTVTTCYQFIHIVYHDVVYTGVPSGRRVRLHRLIASRLEMGYAHQVSEVVPRLAHHYAQGQLYTEAIRYYQMAAQHALSRSGYQEALEQVGKGLALVVEVSDRTVQQELELELMMIRGPAVMAIKGYGDDEVEQAYTRAHELCQQVEESPQRFPALWGLWRFYNTRGDFPTAREVGEELLALASQQAQPPNQLAAHQALGFTLFYLGEFPAARTHLEEGIALIVPAEQLTLANRYGSAPGVTCLALLAQVLWALGYADQARQRSDEACALAESLAHPHSQVSAQFVAARVHLYCRTLEAVHMHTEALMRIATEQAFSQRVAAGRFLSGWVLSTRGKTATGMTQMHRGVADTLATGAALYQPLFLLLLAEAYGNLGQADEGLRILSDALAAVGEPNSCYLLAELYRMKGELLLQQQVPDLLQAEMCFQQALEGARGQAAKGWELRAAISLGRLWQRQGQRQEARAVLAPLYAWFTEGLDTADLQDASVLLQALSD